jgi:hypothetical protein
MNSQNIVLDWATRCIFGTDTKQASYILIRHHFVIENVPSPSCDFIGKLNRLQTLVRLEQ